MKQKHSLNPSDKKKLFAIIKQRFSLNKHRHKGIEWETIEDRLNANEANLWSLNQMEESGGEPDVIGYDKENDQYLIADCSKESPSKRRSICYDDVALNERKEHKPKASAMGMSKKMGTLLMDDQTYILLQNIESIDTKTSSWLQTPESIRSKGGAIFGDNRYGTVFIYHNGAQSYYAARGFRTMLKI
ncbi:MAG TPA: DUF4256 domain-containing protein [Bacteroidia bacterium]|nr:DUF4256 domain-containing protein [Bacteroidia bacterium]